MDITRLFFAIALSLLVLWVYQMWMEYQYPEQFALIPPKEEQQEPSAPGAREGKGSSAQQGEREQPKPVGTPGITVTTDVLRVTFGKTSGDPLRAQLLDYRQENEPSSAPVQLLTPSNGWMAVAQSGWGTQGGPAPSHKATFQPLNPGDITLGEDQAEASVTFVHRAEGLEFRKTYRFRRHSFQVPVDYTVVNGSSEPWQGYLYGQIQKRGARNNEAGFFLSRFTYHGPVVFSGESMQALDHDTLLQRQDQAFQMEDPEGWGGIMSRYFLSVWIPDPKLKNTIFARADGPDSFTGFKAPLPRVAPGEQVQATETLYLGPKEQSLLESLGRNLRRSVDYGVLSFLAIPLFHVLKFFHGIVGNYGFAIMLVVLVLKFLFYPLYSVSYRTMGKMKDLQPKLERLREQYKDNREQLNQEMRKLFREERVNPLGGCLPILVQIPVFISLYWVLLESIELRHEPFILWIDDLTSKDPFYVLPVLMGASMLAQQLLNPTPMDSTQKQILLAMPIVFTAFVTQFPAGLVLYWVTNNLISIAQQWWITRKTVTSIS